MRDIVERQLFGVCQYLGIKMGITAARVRMYFIYLAFGTFGSMLIVYLFIAFWMNIKRYLVNKDPILD